MDTQTLIGFCLTPLKQLTFQKDQEIEKLAVDLASRQKVFREALTDLESTLRKSKDITSQLNHELSHFVREISDLFENEKITDVEIITNGIRVTTKPLSSFKGTHPFRIDLVIGGGKPNFQVIGETYGFQLRCLDGANHDSMMRSLLNEARLAEAAIYAIDLIEFGDEGGPYNNDDNYGNY